MNKVRTLALDPSLKMTGWAVFENDSPIAFGVLVTDKGVGKVSMDDLRRATDISQKILRLVARYKISRLAMEVSMGSQSAAAAKGLALSKGAVAGVIAATMLPVSAVTPFDVKGITGDKRAPKELVIKHVEKMFKPLRTSKKRTTRTGSFTKEHEAVCDAAAVYVASKNLHKEK